MFSTLRSRLTYANVISSLALFLVISGGTAYAVNTIGSDDVIDDSLTSADIKNQTVGTADLAINSVWGSRIRDNAILSAHVVDNVLTGNDVQNNSLTGDDINEATLAGGVTAYFDQGDSEPATFTLPAGKYMIFATTRENFGDESECVLGAGELSDFAAEDGAESSMALQLAGTFSASTVVTASCTGVGAGVYSVELSAIRVDALTGSTPINND